MQTPSQRNNTEANKTLSGPLVSCIVPTANRPEYLEQSIKYYLKQDYANKEMIIVYNEENDLPKNIPANRNIYTVKTEEQSIGEKRNIACANANGEIIAQWDDDDVYGINRLSTQVIPIINKECQVTGVADVCFFGLDNWSFWKCKDDLHRCLFYENVQGGTLVFLKKVWEVAGPYPKKSLGEDAAFLRQALRRKARLKKIHADNIYVYLRHTSNSWRFTLGKEIPHRFRRMITTDSWIKNSEFPLIKENREFYQKMLQKAPKKAEAPAQTRQLWSKPQ